MFPTNTGPVELITGLDAGYTVPTVEGPSTVVPEYTGLGGLLIPEYVPPLTVAGGTAPLTTGAPPTTEGRDVYTPPVTGGTMGEYTPPLRAVVVVVVAAGIAGPITARGVGSAGGPIGPMEVLPRTGKRAGSGE